MSEITNRHDTLAKACRLPCNQKTLIAMKPKSTPTILEKGLPLKSDKSEMVAPPHAWPWRIENNLLEVTPCIYQLERTHIVIADLSAPVICGRVCEFARVHSLDAKWSQAEPNKLHCSSPEQVELVIRVWRSEKVVGGIIVEAKRWKGDCYDAHKLKYLLFKSLQLKKQKFQEARRSNTDRSINDYTNTNVSNKKVQNPTVNLSWITDVTQTIEAATKLMCSRSTEDIVSGLKLMDFLTDPTHVKPGISLFASNLIWKGIDPRKRTKLRATDILRNYVLDRSSCNTIVHFWAVRTLGNVFLHMCKKEDLFQKQAMEEWNQMIPILIDDMINVKGNPHTACYAIRCLRRLIMAKLAFNEKEKGKVFSDEEKRRLRVNIGKVVAYGKELNANIEQEAMKLLSTLLK